MSLSNSCLKLVLHVYIHVTSTKCTCHGLYEKLHTCTLKCFVGKVHIFVFVQSKILKFEQFDGLVWKEQHLNRHILIKLTFSLRQLEIYELL